MEILVTANGIPFSLSAKNITRETFDNAYGHLFKKKEMLEDTWEQLQKAITKYNKANNIEPVITQEEISEAFEEFVEQTEEKKESKKKKKSSKK